MASDICVLALLTAALALEEVDWAGVGGRDYRHPVPQHPLHLQQNGDSR